MERCSSEDEALVLFLNLSARRLAYRHRFRFGGLQTATDVPLDTWLIGPAEDKGQFAEWFGGDLPSERYRIMVYRSPCTYEGHNIPTTFVSSARSHVRKKGFRHRTGAYVPLKRQAERVVEDLLSAYRSGIRSVEDYMQGTGHSFWFSGS